MKAIQRLNEREIDLGVEASGTSWHNQYNDSAYVFYLVSEIGSVY